MDVFTAHKRLQHVLTHKELNLRQRIWLDLLKDYYMSVRYHPNKAIVVANAVSRMLMDSGARVPNIKKALVKGVHRLGQLGV